MTPAPRLPLAGPDQPAPALFDDPAAAVARIGEIYRNSVDFLRARFAAALAGGALEARYRATYPEVRLTTTSHAEIDSRLSFGHVTEPGTYATTLTRPDLFARYLETQIGLLIRNHGVPVEVRASDVPIPIHFAVADGEAAAMPRDGGAGFNLRDHFDVPRLEALNDDIVNGTAVRAPGAPRPLAPFTAPRIDYSLARLRHYTGTGPEDFQNFILFTNYQFYVDEFLAHARRMLGEADSGYVELVGPGGRIRAPDAPLPDPERLPQMPAWHLRRPGRDGITLINIGVGPSNAKTITDHVAVLRPHAWLMVGHCAGLRNSQRLGDYVLAHG
ncbi:MAG: AMP nucleosidase, partial [Alphaproteobacteria bacterium]